ncbi:MAG: NAD-dependent epimerase/dehydratase family protein [Acidobacteriaceae bacterium]|nr:NAD-dependent epimerase/dehydratase family protein [Acidobacteriaceae bacterium]MBV9765204.1 NAD-dependent epimerase/dehydratase family protein [Acidobacteriaceae bacterium]
MKGTVLITGGAGFIGSHVASELLKAGYHVRVLDSLITQVHGEKPERPGYLHKNAEFVLGDVRNPEILDEALTGVDAVYHFVALVGVGQSMYQIAEYTSVNNLGTAVLLERLVKRPVNKLIVASSMSIYGEGLYVTPDGQPYNYAGRSTRQLKAHEWEMTTPDGLPLRPVPTPETKQPSLASVYALSKYDQEQMCLMTGRAYGVPTVALRFFNAYGPFQSLSNPYTGVLAIFASRLLNRKRPIIFEDGHQLRDFVSVYDVAQACRLALEVEGAQDLVFNVGSGQTISVSDVARKLAKVLGTRTEPEITGNYRVGDIRHCFPDISLAKRVLGYAPTVNLEDGMRDLAKWLDQQTAHDRFNEMQQELASRGLVV